MELESVILERGTGYHALSRWEKSELGRDLRRIGPSYGEIMESIPVKKSTLATWCREVVLTPRQIAAIKGRRAQPIGVPRDTQRKRRAEIDAIRKKAAAEVPVLIEDRLWIAGVTLNWAEGSKADRQLRLANTDPNALRLFILRVRRFIDEEASFSLQVHLNEGNDEPAVKIFWREATGLHDANFYKTYIKPTGTGQRKNHIPFGVCTVKVRKGTDGWHTTMAWIESLPSHLGVGTTAE